MTDTTSEEVTPVPDRASTVLVPVANPANAGALLSIAASLADPESGRVIALAVVTGDTAAEEGSEFLAELEDLVTGAAWVPGVSFEMTTRAAGTVARGILDAAADIGADMILLGVHQSDEGRVSLGGVVESVMATAHPDVVVVRMPPDHGGSLGAIGRVVVAVEGSAESRAAVRVGLLVGASYGAGVHVIHVQGSDVLRSVGMRVLEHSLEGVADRERCTTGLVIANDVSRGILGELQPDDLVVVGAEYREAVLEWGRSSPAVEVVRHAPGAVLTVARKVGGRKGASKLERLHPRLTKVEQDTVVWQSERSASLGVDFIVLMAVSSLLASFGLLQSSPAVVIGAMLVAPLLGPLTAVSVGLVIARLDLARKAIVTVLAGAGLAVVAGLVLGWLVPFQAPTSEMLSRGNPTLLDAGVALAAGIVGAYAIGRKEIPAALAGVAIAAALVPPLSTAGLALAIRDVRLASGALLLFLVNMVAVAVIGSVVFLWFGMNPRSRGVRQRRQALSIGILAVGALFSVIGVIVSLQSARQQVVVKEDLSGFFANSEVVDVVYDPGTPGKVVATVRTTDRITSAEVASAEKGLQQRLGIPIDLSVVVETLVVPGS